MPGQFVHVRTPDYSGLVLRRPFSLNTVDRTTGDITIHFRVTGKGTEVLARMRPGDSIGMLGPLGRGFEVDPRTRHLLLIAGGLGMAGVRALADDAIATGRQVTVLFGAASASEVYPSHMLPDEVEYVVATDDGSLGHHGRVTDLVPSYEAWADQAFACGPEPMLAALARTGQGPRRPVGRRTAGQEGRWPGGADWAHRRHVAPRGSRCRWSRPWAVPLGRASAVSSSGSTGRSGSVARVRYSRPTRSCGRSPHETQAIGGHRSGRVIRDRRASRPRGAAPRSASLPGLRSPWYPPRHPSRVPVVVDLSIDLAPTRPGALVLRNPLLVASGTFGYGIEYGEVVDIDRLGAICCKGTTLKARVGNPPPRVTETPAGMLNSIGLQNPGVDAVLEKYAPRWVTWEVPVIVNVAGESVEDYVAVARKLDEQPGVAGIELNISCPNVGKGGLQFALDARAAAEVTAAVRRVTELPLLVKLSPAATDVRGIATAIADAGADAICAVNTLSGMAIDRHKRKPLLGNTYGGPVRAGAQAGRAAGRVRGRPGGGYPASWPSAA